MRAKKHRAQFVAAAVCRVKPVCLPLIPSLPYLMTVVQPQCVETEGLGGRQGVQSLLLRERKQRKKRL
jgi:hypothetical protein